MQIYGEHYYFVNFKNSVEAYKYKIFYRHITTDFDALHIVFLTGKLNIFMLKNVAHM